MASALRPPDWLPTLPEWIPYPAIVWFIIEGLVLGLLGVLVRDLAGPSYPAAVTLGNVLLFVGVSTVVLAGGAYFMLVSIRLYR